MNPLTDELSRWDAPGGAGSLFLSGSTVRELRAKAIQSFLSLPRRGVETGGLLFGSKQDGQIFIQGFEPTPCEHRYGPSFTLSGDERARLAEKLRRAASPAVVGFYRSYTGRHAEIEPADLALVREYFPDGQFVFLLLQPVNAQACTAGFRFCRDGELMAEPAYTPVPFDPELWNADPPSESEEAEAVLETPEPPAVSKMPLLPPPYRTLSRAAEAVPEPAQPPVAEKPPLLPPPFRSFYLDAAPPPSEPPVPRPRVRWWVPVSLCLMGGVLGASLYELWTFSRQPRWTELYLDAKPEGNARSLLVTWDAAASKTTGATHALLGVNDGSVHRDIPLTAAQLQIGRYLYTPANSELELRLVLYGNGPAVSGGTLRLVPTPRLVPAVSPAAVVAAPPSAEATATAPATTEPKATGPREPVHQVQPAIPAGIRARLNGKLEIPVTVRINPRGLVTSAFTPPAEDGLRGYLSREAVRAAHQWRFSPAGGASEKTLYFTFTP